LAFGALQTAATAAAVLRPSQGTATRLFKIGRNYYSSPTPTPTPPVKESPTFTLKEIKDDPKKIKEYILNPDNSIKIPKGSTRDLKSDDISKITKASFRTLVYNGRYSGTPAEIVDGAINILGETAPPELTNYIKPEKAAEEAAKREAASKINALTESEKPTFIRKRASEILEEAAAEQAKQIVEASSLGLTGGGLRGIMGKFLNYYNIIFGRTPGNLTEELIPLPLEIKKTLEGCVDSKGVIEYIEWLPDARTQFYKMSPDAIDAYSVVMTPPVMNQFRLGMLRSFAENPVEAANIFETFTLNVVPNIARNPNSGQLLGEFLTNLRQAPRGQVNEQAREALNTLISGLGKQAMNIGTTTWRNYSSLPLRILSRAFAAGTTGLVGWFMITFQNTANGGGFPVGSAGSPLTESIKNKIYEWFGILLWESPPDNDWASTLASAGGFKTIEEMGRWLAGEGRRWLWAHLGMILTTLGAGVAGLIAYFRDPDDKRPITDEQPLRSPEEDKREGGYMGRVTRRNR